MPNQPPPTGPILSTREAVASAPADICHILALDSLGWDCARSVRAVRDYLTQLAANNAMGHPQAAQRIHSGVADIAQQDNAVDCGLFAASNAMGQ